MMGCIDKQGALDNIAKRAKAELADANHNYLRGFQDAAEEVEQMPEEEAIPLSWLREYAEDWLDMNYAYENPILGMLEDWEEKKKGKNDEIY